MHREAELYSRLSEDHVNSASKCLDKYKGYMVSKHGETALDVGCGPGDVLAKVILPSLHPKFSLLVGLDISPEMISFAEDHLKGVPRLAFRVMDAAEPNPSVIRDTLPVGSFDKIFSFLALQWIRDRRQVAKNIADLLAPGGTALLYLAVRSGVYVMWDTMIQSEKWHKYFSNIKVPLNEYQYMEKPDKDLVEKLKENGLEILQSEVTFHKNVFTNHAETEREKMEKLKSVDPLITLLPEDKKEEYLNELLQMTKARVSPRGAVDLGSLAIVCRKPETIN